MSRQGQRRRINTATRIIEMADLHSNDSIIFPIVVDGRHGIARYPIMLDAAGMITRAHKSLEFYYLNGTNAELTIFQHILKKLDTAPAMNHPDITALSDVQVVAINPRKLGAKRVIMLSYLSYRARDGELVAYYVAPNRMLVATDLVDKPAPANIKCGDGFANRIKFVVNFIVNCYI
ncbi:hypothetical protein F-M6_0363 [Faustovirus]|nr:hypothetical protein F-M6_0363 [Faustovirus]